MTPEQRGGRVARIIAELQNVSATHAVWWDNEGRDGSLATFSTIDKGIKALKTLQAVAYAARRYACDHAHGRCDKCKLTDALAALDALDKEQTK